MKWLSNHLLISLICVSLLVSSIVQLLDSRNYANERYECMIVGGAPNPDSEIIFSCRGKKP
jgi:hypothetical protein